MKQLVLWLLLFSVPAWATNAIVNCASTSVGTSYSGSSPSLQAVFTNFLTPTAASVAVFNDTGGRICFTTEAPYTSVPTAGAGHEHCVPPSSYVVLDAVNTPIPRMSVFLRADQASCTSGFIDLDVW